MGEHSHRAKSDLIWSSLHSKLFLYSLLGFIPFGVSLMFGEGGKENVTLGVYVGWIGLGLAKIKTRTT
jgi:hypothetical protein